MKILIRIRVWLLKRKARGIYHEIQDLHEVYDCGSDLIDMCTGGELTRKMAEIRETVSKAKALEAQL